jgi:hypothetical protein
VHDHRSAGWSEERSSRINLRGLFDAPAGRCPCTPAKRKGLAAPSLLAISHPDFVHRTRRFVWPHAPWGPRVHAHVQLRARPSLHNRALLTTPWEHGATSGPSAAHACTNDSHEGREAAPGPSRTCASWVATGLGACSMCCRVETSDAAEWTTCQPHTRVAREHRSPSPPPHQGPIASRSPAGRGRRQPHTRTVWAHRCPTPPPCRQHHPPAAAPKGAGGASRTPVPLAIVVLREVFVHVHVTVAVDGGRNRSS